MLNETIHVLKIAATNHDVYTEFAIEKLAS